MKHTFFCVLSLFLCGIVCAQPIVVPDSNLRDAIQEELGHDRITQQTLRHLTRLNAGNRDIVNLAGLEHAVSLEWLSIHQNSITDLTPIASCTRITELGIWQNPLSDITPLSNLSQLRRLDASGCHISDIRGIASLTQLIEVNLGWNRITDISPLARLTKLKQLQLTDNQIRDPNALTNLIALEWLEIQANPIVNFAPLEALSLNHIMYDAACNMPPLPLQSRLDNRTFPSIFTAWASTVLNHPQLPEIEQLALHDLYFSTTIFHSWEYFFDTGSQWDVRGHLPTLLAARNDYLTLNPNMLFLREIRVRDAPKNTFPENSPYWLKDSHDKPIEAWPGHYLINFTSPEVQDMIVQQVLAVERCGLYDGVFFDWWSERTAVLADDSNLWTGGYVGFEAEQNARDIILGRIRTPVRPNFLILVNTNDYPIKRTGAFVNGGYMESTVVRNYTGQQLNDKLNRVESTLKWLEQNVKSPQINALQGGSIPSEPPDSPNNLQWMRAITTLSLTHSDGYVQFAIGSGNNHLWYDFWDADLGRPVGEKSQLYQGIDGLYIREFTNGWAVYNHSGSEQNVTFLELVTGVANGLEGYSHTLPNLDGEMYLRVKPANPADVNGDGVVNIFDLTLVAQAMGTDGAGGDVNGDGVVNVFDLVFVAGAIGGGGAAPSAYSPDLSIISAADVERWLAGAQGLGVGDANFQRGIRFLEGLLAALTPKETTLLPNYPNPFNPETWIPYRLAREAEVAITIYDTKGAPVRRLALGNQAAGYYAERGKAAYWDGRNELGEAVASGIYVYQFRAGDYAASRRMAIVK